MLSKFTGLEWNGSEYDGFTLLVQGDPRDVSADRFKLEVYDPPGRGLNTELAKPTNTFKLTMPLVSAGLYQDREELVQDDTAQEVVKKSLIVTMQRVKDLEEGANKKEFVLGFKNGISLKLTDKPFIPRNEAADELVIKPFHPVAFYDTGHKDYDEEGNEIGALQNMSTYVSWRLCDVSSKRKLTDDAKKGPAGASGVAAALAARRKKAKSSG